MSVVGLERALHHYTLEPSEQPFDMKTVPLDTQPFGEKKVKSEFLFFFSFSYHGHILWCQSSNILLKPIITFCCKIFTTLVYIKVDPIVRHSNNDCYVQVLWPEIDVSNSWDKLVIALISWQRW